MQNCTDEEVKLAVEQGNTFCLYVYTPMCGTSFKTSPSIKGTTLINSALNIAPLAFLSSRSRHLAVPSVSTETGTKIRSLLREREMALPLGCWVTVALKTGLQPQISFLQRRFPMLGTTRMTGSCRLS